MTLALRLSNGHTITINNVQLADAQKLVDTIRNGPQWMTLVSEGEQVLVNRDQIVSLDLPDGVH